ncbi:MAG TPA: FKBP-type peptidyl-prolyl cis-trans isomerase [Chitinophagales bacterium]|nr:FKBP-type peptidyl-prolyl cis-trans isomerase [Chitinophagales bacterium]HRK25993.1 FKBP-type peptidyl-prolyl cis-trans isomerase [Chitinophagales bacterium]HRK27081.1 FKBP-type peptidyl-prolyl cis-trans isomerase [Chitinophagales bacterium]
MIISKDKVVGVSYVLRQDNAQGEVVEATETDAPFEFLFGAGNLLPEFEDNLAGLKEGDSFAFNIDSANAYGEADPDAVVQLPIDIFIIDGQLAGDLLQIGNVIPMRNDQGHLMHGKVVSFDLNTVTMDFNHPMAGIDLFFSGTVLSVREASPSEIEHGHVHGPDGHHHHH